MHDPFYAPPPGHTPQQAYPMTAPAAAEAPEPRRATGRVLVGVALLAALLASGSTFGLVTVFGLGSSGSGARPTLPGSIAAPVGRHERPGRRRFDRRQGKAVGCHDHRAGHRQWLLAVQYSRHGRRLGHRRRRQRPDPDQQPRDRRRSFTDRDNGRRPGSARPRSSLPTRTTTWP